MGEKANREDVPTCIYLPCIESRRTGPSISRDHESHGLLSTFSAVSPIDILARPALDCYLISVTPTATTDNLILPQSLQKAYNLIAK